MAHHTAVLRTIILVKLSFSIKEFTLEILNQEGSISGNSYNFVAELEVATKTIADHVR